MEVPVAASAGRLGSGDGVRRRAAGIEPGATWRDDRLEGDLRLALLTGAAGWRDRNSSYSPAELAALVVLVSKILASVSVLLMSAALPADGRRARGRRPVAGGGRRGDHPGHRRRPHAGLALRLAAPPHRARCARWRWCGWRRPWSSSAAGPR